MPIYEYRCATCGHEIEALQKFADSPLTECPACHKPDLRKKVSAAGFHLKGSGWYVTDFRDKGAKQPAKDASAKAGAKPNGGDAKPEAKPGDGAAVASPTAAPAQTRSKEAASESKAAAAPSGDKTNS